MATSWTAQSQGVRSGRAVQTGTETIPATPSGFGPDLDSVGFVAVVITAPTGQTFDGSGTMRAARLLDGAWVFAPRADVDMADYMGLSRAALPSMTVDSPIGRFLYFPSGVGLSGGTAITTDYFCTLRSGAPG